MCVIYASYWRKEQAICDDSKNSFLEIKLDQQAMLYTLVKDLWSKEQAICDYSKNSLLEMVNKLAGNYAYAKLARN